MRYGKMYNNTYLALLGTINFMKQNNLNENMFMMPEDFVRIMCPLGFENYVNQYAKKFNAQPNMIYSVIKAESIFNHRAVSSVGAVGLMQLMPATAKGIARDLKMKDYSLSDPETSVIFGAHYLSWLGSLFKNNFDDMVAGYNAGPGNVQRWRLKPAIDNDFYNEFVPFDETKYYITRTGKYLMQYDIFKSAGCKKIAIPPGGKNEPMQKCIARWTGCAEYAYEIM